ncbi:MAG: 16S rRNA (cytosine(967)-C(5))-methyltransferase RsmB, partial [Acidobacteriota bacterium]
DRFISQLAGNKRIDVEVCIALRLALYQLIYLDKVPPYSAINESVNLVQRAKKTSAKGFVNAVLRRATREKIEISFADEIDRISVETSHPRWLIEKWVAEFGIDEASKVAVANNEKPDIAFRLIGQSSEAVRSLADASRRSDHVDGCYVAERGSSHLFNLSQIGEIYIQDEASQMVAQAVEIPPLGLFLDVCAAPGGKTGLIAARNSAAARLLAAGDLHWPRVEYLRDNCRKQGVDSVQIVQYDAERSLPFVDESFDSVLVDAPCSGTGTIRSNPEIRYFLRSEDFSELSKKQLAILMNASKLVKSGGLLIYSTCSIEREENEDVCGKFLAGNTEFESIRPNVSDGFITDNGFARTWPHRDRMDGFFIAAFRRN